ncbi:unnamed protein product [Rotaria sp. Silwood2]|nr:unnamed protein product [Rotaria sp. Silwood2]
MCNLTQLERSARYRTCNNVCDLTDLSPEVSFSHLLSACPNYLRISEHDSHEIYCTFWLDANLNMNNQDIVYSKHQLKNAANDLRTFTDIQTCSDIIRQTNTTEKIFLIVSGSLGEKIVPEIHQLPQINSIYVFCANTSKHIVWANKYPTIKGVFDDIQLICESLAQDTLKYETDDISKRILDSSTHDLLVTSSSQLPKEPTNYASNNYDSEQLNEYQDIHAPSITEFDQSQPLDDTQLKITSAQSPFPDEQFRSSPTSNEIMCIGVQPPVLQSLTVIPTMTNDEEVEFTGPGTV